mgnify:CR=1 FL=1
MVAPFVANRDVYSSETFLGLIPNLVGITPEKAIKLAVNDYARELLARKYNVAPEKLPIGLGVVSEMGDSQWNKFGYWFLLFCIYKENNFIL